MENKDPSIFSGHGKAIFSEIHTSEVTMGNPNTEDEKKSKIENENQEIKRNQENNGEINIRSESNSLECEIGLGIVGDGKIGMKIAIQEIKNLETGQTSNYNALTKEDPILASVSSGLDDSGMSKKEKSENKNSNKTGSIPVNLPSGIPKYSNQLSQMKNVENQIGNAGNDRKKISPATMLGKGKEGKEIPALSLALESDLREISLLTRQHQPSQAKNLSTSTTDKGKEGKEIPVMTQAPESNTEKKKLESINLSTPGINSNIPSTTKLGSDSNRVNSGNINRKISPSSRQSMGKAPTGLADVVNDGTSSEKKKTIPPVNPRNPSTGKYTSRLSLTSDQQVRWKESQEKGEKNPYLGPPNMSSADIDLAAQKVRDRVRLSTSWADSADENETAPTSQTDTRGTMDSTDRVNVSNIYANLGGESTSEDDDGTGNDPGGATTDALVVVKTTKSKKSTNVNLAFMSPSYETVTKEEPRQPHPKYRCQKFKTNRCSAGNLCLFSHDMDTTRYNATLPERPKPDISQAFDGVMFELDSGSYQASVEAQGKSLGGLSWKNQ